MTMMTTRRSLLGAMTFGAAAAAVGCGMVGKIAREDGLALDRLSLVGQAAQNVKPPTPQRIAALTGADELGGGMARVRLERWMEAVNVAVWEVLDDALPAFPSGSMVFGEAVEHPGRRDDLVIAWDVERWIVTDPTLEWQFASDLTAHPASAAWWRLPADQQLDALLADVRSAVAEVAAHGTPEERRAVRSAIAALRDDLVRGGVVA